MPPVRWNPVKLCTLLCLLVVTTDASSLQDAVSMSSDGWRPIIGKSQLEVQDEITLYKNPSQTDENSKPVKAQTPPPTPPPPKSSTKSYQTISATQAASATSNTIGNKQPTAKTQPKQYKPFHLAHGHGPHIPLSPMGYKGSPHRIPIQGKHGPLMLARPIRGPHPGPSVSHSMRHEVIVPAPSAAIGSFALFNNHPPGFSKKHFANVHGLNDPIFQNLPVQSYLIQNRNPVQIDGSNVFNHNDEYTRNLVPPPFKEIHQAKESAKPKEHEGASTINNPTLVIGKHKERLPDAVLVQLPPSFEAAQFEVHSQKPTEPIDQKPVEIQVTKERLNVFHNSIPNNYNPEGQYQPQIFPNIKPNDDVKIYSFDINEPTHQVIDLPRKPNRHKQEPKKASEAPHFPTYEVTEGKQWQEPPPSYYPTRPSVVQFQASVQPDPPQIRPQPEVVFLPTPYRPDNSVPTSPTQGEIAEIYNHLRNRQPEISTELPPHFFSIKEVSTHYPILGKPESPTILSISAENTDFSNDITDSSEEKSKIPQIYQPVDEPEPTTLPPPVRNWQEKRPQQRRRRPSPRPRTTTEAPTTVTEVRNIMKIKNSEEIRHSGEDYRPQRRRRPTRVRTTSTTSSEESQEQTTMSSKRRNRVRPSSGESVEEMPFNHKLTGTISYSVMQPVGETYINSEIHPPAEELPISYENEVTKGDHLHIQVQPEENTKDEEEHGVESEITTTTPSSIQTKKRTRPTTIPPVTETTPFTVPVRNFEVLTEYEPSITIQEIYTKSTEEPQEETTLPPTTTTTSTEAPTSVKSNRLRTRPLYDTKNRPRFSVKEYRQRLTQYTSTSTTEASSRSTTEAPIRSRYPNRSRKTTTEQPTERSKFIPKEPRHSTAAYSEITPERKVNTRLRPFGRQRSTEGTTTTTTGSPPTTLRSVVKPNVFSNLKRPPPITLRQRIYNKYNRTSTSTPPPEDEEEEGPVEKADRNSDTLVTTHSVTNKVLQVDSEEDNVSNTELMRNDVLLQSQRVSDLTSSAHKEYETPGLFKSVSPNTRIVPSYFTLSTDDPILPIEAFFTNLKDKRNES